MAETIAAHFTFGGRLCMAFLTLVALLLNVAHFVTYPTPKNKNQLFFPALL